MVKLTRGFTLAEMAVVLVVVGALMFAILPGTVAMQSAAKRSATTQKLSKIETAIINYVVVNRRLPCPANGTLTVGTEAPVGGGAACTANQANGVVPWATLGLSFPDILDEWGNQITYRVGYGLTQGGALDMTYCDPAGTALGNPNAAGSPAVNMGLCNSGTCVGAFAEANCTSPQNFLLRKGLDVKSDTATLMMNYGAYTGAAFVLISHGDNGYGAITANRTYQSTATKNIAGTTLENPNRNLDTLTVGSNAPPQFMDTTFSDANDATTYYDDILVRPSLISVINRAQLGPRSH